MTQVTFNRNIADRSYLPHAGKYGQGLDYEADVELTEFEFMTEDKPAYAKDDPSRNFAKFVVKVIYEGKVNWVRHHEPIDPGSGSRVFDWLASLGVEFDEDSDGNVTFDAGQVAPRKITGIQLGDPRPDKNKKNADGSPVMYTGNLDGVGLIG